MKLRNIIDALIEGCFLRRSVNFLKKSFYRFPEFFDLRLGTLFRFLYFRKAKVINNRIVFCAFQGDYTDNPKYICEELIKQKVQCEIIWIGRKFSVNHPDSFPKGISSIYEWYSAKAYESIATAKVIVLNSVELYKRPVLKKKGQIIIETWHGSLGFKRFDKNVNSGKAWVNAAKFLGKHTDYLLSNSKFENDVYRTSFWPSTKILEFGHPRNDCLVNSKDSRGIRNKLFRFLDIADCGQKILLYAPTFRDSKSFSMYNMEYENVRELLEKQTGNTWLVLLRFHPTVRKYVKKSIRFFDGIVNVTDYPDMNELLQITDIGISDYSSWLCDFLLTKRPAFIYATDLEKYYTERGFYYPLETTPFSIATNNDELMYNISSFDYEQYQRNCDEFLKDKGCIEDGHASERVVDFIEKIITGDNVRKRKILDRKKMGGGNGLNLLPPTLLCAA